MLCKKTGLTIDIIVYVRASVRDTDIMHDGTVAIEGHCSHHPLDLFLPFSLPVAHIGTNHYGELALNEIGCSLWGKKTQ